MVNELAKDLKVALEDKKYVAKVYKIIFTGVILDWIKSNMNEAPEEIVNNLDKIISGDIYRTLLKYEERKSN